MAFEHDGGAPTLARDREVFSRKDRISAVPAGVYTSEKGMHTVESAGATVASAAPEWVALNKTREAEPFCPSHCHAIPSSTATAVEGTPLLHEFYFQTSPSDIVGCCAVLECLGRATLEPETGIP
ncbi:hypothetical protein BDBG_06186 [Blastomyces gilchristii SLH14081]|uniref:Uncharacterized protein n=1 Tax=Blastomyces gilchristii (strain SLH14081) TaxID=559298 RepID=A0A179UTW8_BLAGS|nr:uncharacterized protein BDBG_06186 [Blastomyces gilchristii SLH14081]OAT11243.1 hypothetical protein BDBG_06186 [Blastomyces gilchristii SLH14081]